MARDWTSERDKERLEELYTLLNSSRLELSLPDFAHFLKWRLYTEWCLETDESGRRVHQWYTHMDYRGEGSEKFVNYTNS